MVVVLVFAIFSGVLLERLHYYQEVAEKTEMEMTIRSLRNGLRARVAMLQIEGRFQQVGRLVDENPMEWLEQKPKNYLGVVRANAARGLAGGNWYFDPDSKMLVYLIRSGEHFLADAGSRKQVKLKVRIVQSSTAQEQKLSKVDAGTGIVLQVEEPYRWF